MRKVIFLTTLFCVALAANPMPPTMGRQLSNRNVERNAYSESPVTQRSASGTVGHPPTAVQTPSTGKSTLQAFVLPWPDPNHPNDPPMAISLAS